MRENQPVEQCALIHARAKQGDGLGRFGKAGRIAHASDDRQQQHEAASEQEQYAQDFLGVQKAIGDQATKDGGDDRRQRPGGVGIVAHSPHAMANHVQAHTEVPSAPDEELQKHQD